MLTTILLVVGALVGLCGLVLVVCWVRKIENEVDYPDAHASGGSAEGRAILQIGAGLSNLSNTPVA